MLFNSYDFIFLFLPCTLAGFFLFGAFGYKRSASLFLVLASLFFYGYWDANYLPLLLGSVLLNFSLGRWLSPGERATDKLRQALLLIGVSLNLLALSYFKYTGFFIETINALTAGALRAEHIVLPLAISFFTITQIAYLVDAYSGKVREYSLLDYMLFVTTFQHLIAGPIVHHKSLAPQFQSSEFFRPQIVNISVGLTFFVIGLAKKVLVADQMAPYADATFSIASEGVKPFFLEAWLGILAFIVQIYYDFSGYSEMAIGLGLLFNIRLPVNFASPYQAVNISDLWRRWHVTLSQFLREYLFTPLALFTARRGWGWGVYPALMLTMVIAGLWHGAGNNYVLFGLLMGVYICVHYLWQSVCRRWIKKTNSATGNLVRRVASKVLTFFCVVVAWVIFRADTPRSAWIYLQGMLSSTGGSTGTMHSGLNTLSSGSIVNAYIAVLPWIAIVLFLPNILWWMADYSQELELDKKLRPKLSQLHRFLKWRPNVWWGCAAGIGAVFSLIGIGEKTVNFIYFQF
jgi:D-alanyl-lipoteichoic acid acyltransferase DltB (MBOAT superfamily)